MLGVLLLVGLLERAHSQVLVTSAVNATVLQYALRLSVSRHRVAIARLSIKHLDVLVTATGRQLLSVILRAKLLGRMSLLSRQKGARLVLLNCEQFGLSLLTVEVSAVVALVTVYWLRGRHHV